MNAAVPSPIMPGKLAILVMHLDLYVIHSRIAR